MNPSESARDGAERVLDKHVRDCHHRAASFREDHESEHDCLKLAIASEIERQVAAARAGERLKTCRKCGRVKAETDA